MDQSFILNMALLAAIPLFFFIGYGLSQVAVRRNAATSQKHAQKLIDDVVKEAEQKKKELELDMKSKILQRQADFENEIRSRREELYQYEQRLVNKEEQIEKKISLYESKESGLLQWDKKNKQQQEFYEEKERELNGILKQQNELLQRAAGLGAEEAKKIILMRMDQELLKDKAAMIKKYEEEAVQTADRKAKELLAYAVKKYGSGHVAEALISVVALPGDEHKGRVIGREGRNIRAFEAATGVNVIVDDTPEAIVLSSFDPFRREVARLALEQLIKDGRIHPAHIDDVVAKVKCEMEEVIKDLGDQLALEVGVRDLHPEIIKLLGRLNYRTSYGQNLWQHSREVAFVMGHLAAEMNLDIDLAKRIGLLHDLGKAVSHDIEGSHAMIGADLARKYQESDVVVNAIAAHHDDEQPQSIYAVLACAADAVSASRPGARRSTMEEYVDRLEKLETIAKSFKGVEKTFALQAGREVRVVVHPQRVSDDEAVVMARDIAKRIEEELTYPGQIKVTIMRETHAVEYAR